MRKKFLMDSDNVVGVKISDVGVDELSDNLQLGHGNCGAIGAQTNNLSQ